jgi:hypothetical protein
MDVKGAVLKGVLVACVGARIGGLWACAENQTPSLGPVVDASVDTSFENAPSDGGAPADGPSDGGESEATSPPPCPDLGYPACPSPPPSWATEVRPIVDLYCSPCHFNGGTGVQKGDDFSTAAGVQHVLTTSLTDLHNCSMPPQDAAVMPTSRRETLMAWLGCGAPNN